MDILAEARARHTDYAAIKERCKIRIVDNREVDISIIIPVYGRTQFHSTVTRHLKNAIEFANKTPATVNNGGFLNRVYDTAKPQKKISLTFVEHSPEPQHEGQIADWVNYIWIPFNGQAFNKCLCFNSGFLWSNKAQYYLLHDSDVIVPENYFVDLFSNVKDFDAIQTFTKRRLLYCNEAITNRIIEGRDNIYNAHSGSKEIKVGESGAAGGSILCKREAFLSVGGLDPEFCSEYSIEDQLFFDKLHVIGKFGFADHPPIELVHLWHPPSFNQTTKPEDWDAWQSFINAPHEHKIEFLKIKSENLKKYIPKIIPMKIQLDTENKVIKIEEQTILGELFDILARLLPNGEWKNFKLESTVINNWLNPIVIPPLVTPNQQPFIPSYPCPQFPWIAYYGSTSSGTNENNASASVAYMSYSVNPGVYNIELEKTN